MPKVPREKLELADYGLTIGDGELKDAKKITHAGIKSAWNWYDEEFDRLSGKKQWSLNILMDRILSRYKFLLYHKRDERSDFKLTKVMKEYVRFARPYKTY